MHTQKLLGHTLRRFPALSGKRYLNSDFQLLNLRVGYVNRVDVHKESDKLYVSQLEIGPDGCTKQVCSGLREHLPAESICGQLVVLVNNMKKCKLRGEVSEAMLLCGDSGEKVQLCRPQRFDKDLVGKAVVLRGYNAEEPTTRLIKRKEWEDISSRLYVGDNGRVIYRDLEGQENELCIKNTDIGIIVNDVPKGTPIR